MADRPIFEITSLTVRNAWKLFESLDFNEDELPIAEPIVTEIVPFTKFFPAEDYHQDYFAPNPEVAYCSIVVGPKVQKFRSNFGDRLKTD